MISEIINRANIYAAEIKFIKVHCPYDGDTTPRMSYMINDLQESCNKLATDEVFSQNFSLVFFNQLFLLVSHGAQISYKNVYSILLKPLLTECPAEELTEQNISNLIDEFLDHADEILSHKKRPVSKVSKEVTSPTLSDDSAIGLDQYEPAGKRICKDDSSINPDNPCPNLLGTPSLYCNEEL